METKTRKAKLNEINKLKREIAELEGKTFYDKAELNKIEVAKCHLQNERSQLDKITNLLDSKGKARLKELNEIIPKLEVQLRLDRAILSGEIKEGFSVQKIGKSKVTLFN